MEHYITKIKITKLRHLSNITISLNPEQKQHLIITGKNGSGKTSLLFALQNHLKAINRHELLDLVHVGYRVKKAKTPAEKSAIQNKSVSMNFLPSNYEDEIELQFHNYQEIDDLYQQGNFITAFFPANRETAMIRTNGVKEIKFENFYPINSYPGNLLHQYMVHLKTQQSYARNEGDTEHAERIQQWFDRFTDALRILLDDASITLKYNYKDYNFLICENGRIPFSFDELSDGYSSVIHIVSDLILRMDKNWLLGNGLSQYDAEGIVLIDELETHLHIELQKKILPFLTTFFPKIQFLVTTHSPYILNSISNAKAYDLERCVELEHLSSYTSDGLAEGYFGADEYANELKEKIMRFTFLKEKNNPTEEERAERAKLRMEFKHIPPELASELFGERKEAQL